MTSPSFPGALDALANPGATTETDDTGFELDIVVSRLQNCIMAIEAKLGIGSSTPPGTAAVLRRTATNASAWGQVAAGDVNAGSTAFRVLRTSDGTTAAWGQAGTADIAPNAATMPNTLNIPTTSTTFTTSTQMAGSGVAITTIGFPVLLMASGTVNNNTAGNYVALSFGVDGAALTAEYAVATSTAISSSVPFAMIFMYTPTAATHTYSLFWRVSAGAGSLSAAQITVVELRR